MCTLQSTVGILNRGAPLSYRNRDIIQLRINVYGLGIGGHGFKTPLHLIHINILYFADNLLLFAIAQISEQCRIVNPRPLTRNSLDGTVFGIVKIVFGIHTKCQEEPRRKFVGNLGKLLQHLFRISALQKGGEQLPCKSTRTLLKHFEGAIKIALLFQCIDLTLPDPIILAIKDIKQRLQVFIARPFCKFCKAERPDETHPHPTLGVHDFCRHHSTHFQVVKPTSHNTAHCPRKVQLQLLALLFRSGCFRCILLLL